MKFKSNREDRFAPTLIQVYNLINLLNTLMSMN